MRVSSSSRLRIAPNSRAISDSVSSVLVYSRSCSNSRAFSIATATCARELAQHRFVGLGELPERVAEQVQRADDAALPPQRHDELGVRARAPPRRSADRRATSLTRIGCPSATAAPTSPCPTFRRSVRATSSG